MMSANDNIERPSMISSSTPKLSGPEILPSDDTKVKSLVILLHGLGADGDDLIGLADQWKSILPDTAFISPQAPYQCDLGPFGYQWFSMSNPDPEVMFEKAKETAPILNQFIDEQLARFELTPENLILVGFSQGTMMSLYVALRREKACRGVLGYSGALLGPQYLVDEAKSHPHCFLIHGTDDQVVPFWALNASVEALKTAKVPVQYSAREGLGHGIDPEGLALGGRFIQDCFKADDSEASVQ